MMNKVIFIFLSVILMGCEAESLDAQRAPSSELGNGARIITNEQLNEIIKNHKPDPNNPHGFKPDFTEKAPYSFVAKSRACQKNYIRKDKSYGPAAQSLINRFKYMSLNTEKKAGEPDPRHYKRLFMYQSSEIAQSCPRYNNMSYQERFHLHMWNFTSIAFVESNCGSNAVMSDDVYGASICDYQLPEHEEGRRPKWRGPGCDIDNDGRPPKREYIGGNGKLSKTKYEMANQDTCSACAIEIMGKSLCGAYKPGQGGKCKDRVRTQKLYGKHMFWQELKHKKNKEGQFRLKKILDLMKKYPGCKE